MSNSPITLCLSVATSALEELYLQSPANYRIIMSRAHLPKIEKIFDAIIFNHGIKPVNFEYVFDHARPVEFAGQDIFITSLLD